MKRLISNFSYLAFLYLFFHSSTVQAQIESDRTLPINSNVIRNGLNFTINDGTVRGNNLFHSFKKFNVLTGGEAFFNNITSIENIFTRVTGDSISNIDGIIKANGSANLFLMNPAGIIFGENARLNIGGSFFGTTANSINFSDGNEFSAINPQAPPLLTINVPIGLQMGTNPGNIIVNGSGHNLKLEQDAVFSPVIGAGQSSTGLQVQSGKTLALLGGDLSLEQGVLTAREGRIELGAVNSDFISLKPITQGWELNYDNVNNFRDISLYHSSLVDTSGFANGDIQLVAKDIKLKSGSLIANQNQGLLPSGTINIQASELLELNSSSSGNVIDTNIVSEVVAKGSGANIIISAKHLSVQNGAGVYTRTFTDAKGGSLQVNVSDSIKITGISTLNPALRSGLYTITYSSGNANDMEVSASSFRLIDGGSISSSTFGTGNGGNVNVNAKDSIELIGYEPSLLLPSLIGSTSLNSGNAGNLTINSQRLSLKDGARVDSSTFATGDGGSVNINASKSIQVTGFTELPNLLLSSASAVPENVQQLFRLPSIPTGNAGNVNINTPELKVEGNSIVAAYNQGFGDAGKIKINANSIFLNNKGSIAAATVSGKGGDIFFKAQNLTLRNNSNITATAFGEGNGGNIEINTDTLVALENSDITANAQNSFGGNVNISAQGIFGTQKRDEITNQSDITASSQLGASFSGTVELNTPGIDPSKGVNQLPANIIDPTNQIASGCLAQPGNSFLVTGKGGVPQNPSDRVIRNIIWNDIRNLSAPHQKSDNQSTNIIRQRKIVEATKFQIDELGRIELVAQVPENFQNLQQMSNCGEV